MILEERRGSVTILRMQKGKVNALDLELLVELRTKLEAIQNESQAVILTGAGSCFSAGVDLFRVLDGGQTYLEQFLPALSEVLLRLFTFPRPVVAAVNGHAIAGGCVIVCACDYRIMAEGDGRIGVSELRVGVPFPVLPLEIMRFAVSNSHLQSLVYTGRTLLPEDAKAAGLVDEVVPAEKLLHQACETAEHFGAVPTNSFALTKALLRQPTLAQYQAAREKHDAAAAEIWASAEIHQTIRAYLDQTLGRNKGK